MRDPVELATRLVGGVWGHLVGDAVGVPYEFTSAEQVAAKGVRFGATGTHGQPPGTWSDDGALMLALLDSLTAEGVGFDLEDQGRRAVAWYREGAYTPDGRVFDIGGTTSQALAAIESGTPAAEAGPTDDMSCGNGSLMRILPIALVGRSWSDAELIERAHAASRVTHGHPRAQVACSLYVLVAARLLAGERDREAALEEATRIHPPSEALDHLLGWTERRGRGRVWDSFWSAWDAFAGASSYQETIERAIAYGNDTDTTAAIAGGLAGVYWGIDGVPGEWLDGMRGRDVVVPLVDRLLATEGWRTSTLNPLRVDWVDADLPWSGRLGMTFLPGKQRDGWSGLHWRDLSTDVRRLRDVHGADALLLLVEDHELVGARVSHIGEAMADAGIELLRFPIADMTVTSDEDGLRVVLDDVLVRLAAGQRVVVACRGGLGRTGTVVGCLLRDAGLDGQSAIDLTHRSRHDTIQGHVQEQFVADWDWPRREVLG
jgi:ADP-ribosylglycohydrolase/protein-tyrosine phosphatase